VGAKDEKGREVVLALHLPAAEAAARLRAACAAHSAPYGFVDGNHFEIGGGDLWAPVLSGDLVGDGEDTRLVAHLEPSQLSRQLHRVWDVALGVVFAGLALYVAITAVPGEILRGLVGVGAVWALVMGALRLGEVALTTLGDRERELLTLRSLLFRVYGLSLPLEDLAA